MVPIKEDSKEVTLDESIWVRFRPAVIFMIFVGIIGATYTFTVNLGEIWANDKEHSRRIEVLDAEKVDTRDFKEFQREIRRDLKLIKKSLKIPKEEMDEE